MTTYFDSGIGMGRVALLVAVIAIALGFEFVNGFHDTANAVATVIYTRSLRPWYAVIWSGFCNFCGVYLGGIAVAMSIIKLLPVELLASSGSGAGLAMVLALLVAAIAWNLATWYFGLPASSSHTLIGAIVGVGLANSLGPGHVFGSGVNWHKVEEIGLSLVVSPIFGMALAGLLLVSMRKLLPSKILHQPADPEKVPPWGVRAVLIGTCSGVSFAHGSNDGQKGVGLLMLILIGVLPADFALNRAYNAQQVEHTIAVAQEISGVTRMAYADAEPPKLAANAPMSTNESTASKVVADLDSIRATLTGKHSLLDVPPSERWALRTKVLRVDANLTALEKNAPKALTAQQAETLKTSRKELRNMVDYAPAWVLIAIALALGIGTMVGWKRIVVTIGEKIGKTHMSYSQGASAELVAASTIGVSAYMGLPVSTTHVLSSGIAGTMVANRSGLQSSTVRNIALAWLLTLPVAVILAGVLFMVFRAVIPDAPSTIPAKVDSATITTHDTESTPMPRVISATPLRLGGSNTLGADLAPALAEAFFARKGGTHIVRQGAGGQPGTSVSADLPKEADPLVVNIEAAGTATAFECLATKTCDVGLASRRATPEEAARVAGAGLGDVLSPENEHVIGLDGIAVIVNAKNPKESVRISELARIFSGETKTWTGDLGVIKLLARDDNSGTLDVFRTLVLGTQPLGRARRFGDNASLADAVAADEHAIGFVPMHATRDAKALDVGDEGNTPLLASDFTVSTESYPLTRRIYLYTTPASTHPLAREFLAFAVSPEGQKVVADAGFVSLSIKTRPASPCAASCPPKYAALTEKAERLSIDFRFQSSSTALDSRGREDLNRVKMFLKDKPSMKLALFGFSDDVGSPEANAQISLERAKVVETELRNSGVETSVVDSFGEAMPIASNATAIGRERNRRVEAWLVRPPRVSP